MTLANAVPRFVSLVTQPLTVAESNIKAELRHPIFNEPKAGARADIPFMSVSSCESARAMKNVFKPDAVKASTVKASTVEANTVKPDAVKPDAVNPDPIERSHA